ncbi:hypothetical protein PAAG_06454 [Paracoccidioides lutzii Pb01]|uniref:Uncharacterized protein n=1 Tax=Paracoccidioides lutzii (strain ATCC MYA-826 / Pb01) TaxID=502779 RepID=C1H6R3_PARBA|nr:hypothetical protein PAAG_06454 [Paracoccidioides lutzii Pb01]EEH35407.2 hypothetical protein PAAG_06454 [Paracoccidioides lutzii Pb01]
MALQYPSPHRLVGALASTVKLLFRTFGQQHEGYAVDFTHGSKPIFKFARRWAYLVSSNTNIRWHPFRHTVDEIDIGQIMAKKKKILTEGFRSPFYIQATLFPFPFPVIEASVQKKLKLRQARWARVRMNKTITGIFLPGKSDKAY